MVLLLVNRNPQPGSKPNYWVNSHLSACWSGKNASSMIDLTAALPSGPPLHHPNHPLSTFFHRGLRPKLNMSKQDDTDNSHNRSNHMLPHLETTERFFNFQITYKSWKTDCVTVMYRYIYVSQQNVISLCAWYNSRVCANKKKTLWVWNKKRQYADCFAVIISASINVNWQHSR